MRTASFPNSQEFDLEGLKSRLLSSSYTPEQSHPSCAPMTTELEHIFDTKSEDGVVRFLYDTQVYFGRFDA
jgi:hypothetical protein